MVDGISKGGMHDAEFLGHGGSMGQQLTDPDSPVIVLMLCELVFARAYRECLLPCGHTSNPLAVTNMLRQVLAEHLPHFRLIVPEVMVTWTAAHKQVDDPLGLRGMMQASMWQKLAGALCHGIGAQDLAHGSSAKAKC